MRLMELMWLVCVDGYVEVGQTGSGGDNGERHAVKAETLQRLGAELLEQTLGRGVIGEHPVLEFEGEVSSREHSGDTVLGSALNQQLLGGERA